jgi:uncharacterized protein with NAD-binding domain and iron-sulfur cluster
MQRWDQGADVVVVGTGGAALAAAAAAVDHGASVVMLEAAAEPGGTTRRSGGAFWIPNNSLMRAQGFTDPRDDALKLMARLAYPSLYDPAAPRLGLPQLQYELLAAFYDNGSSERSIRSSSPTTASRSTRSRTRTTSRSCPRTGRLTGECSRRSLLPAPSSGPASSLRAA